MVLSMAGKKKDKQIKKSDPEKVHTEIITTHINADFDALASMIAAKRLYPEATLVFSGSQPTPIIDHGLDGRV